MKSCQSLCRNKLERNSGTWLNSLIVCAIGGTNVGKPLLELCGQTCPLIKEGIPGLRLRRSQAFGGQAFQALDGFWLLLFICQKVMLKPLVDPSCPPVPVLSVSSGARHQITVHPPGIALLCRRGRRVDKLTTSYGATVDEIPSAVPEPGALQKANALRSLSFGLELVKRRRGI